MTSSSLAISHADVRPIRRWLQINVCVLCCLAGIVFAAAEGSPLALISVPLAIIGLLYIDRRDAAGMASLWANILGFAALYAAVAEFFGESIEGRLLGFGHLLLYLTWILLLQRKGNAQFWWLCAMSTLQMATASVLTTDLWFPLAAIVYMLLALWTLSVFTLDRAVSHAAGVEQSARQVRNRAGTSETEASAGETSRSRSNVQTQTATRWVTPRFLLGVLINGALSLLVGLSIFVLTPRIWAGGMKIFRDTPTEATQPQTGFAEEVSLGDMGEILENPKLVMEVAFYSDNSDQALDVEQTMSRLGYEAPLFRGKVLGDYENGRWSPPDVSSLLHESRKPHSGDFIRQEIRRHPIGTYTLFAAGNALALDSEEKIEINHDYFDNTFLVERSSTAHDVLAREFDYVAYARASGVTRPWKDVRFSLRRSRNEYEQAMLGLPEGLNRLTQLAADIVQSGEATPLSTAEQAQRLVDHLRSSGGFTYSLSMAIDDPSIDPVEDFLFNRKQGHCEYYASALTLMLRAIGIPARLISGFKGGEFNQVTGRFEVRQLHAHAWVEALIDNEWEVLDPTPAAREESVAGISTSIGSFTKLQRYLQSWWSRSLMMNQAQQREAIYEPLKDFIGEWADTVRRVGLIRGTLEWLRVLRANPGAWISIRGFFTAFIIMLLLSMLVWLGRRIWRLLSSWSSPEKRRRRQQRQIVDFYERFRSLMARQGLVRHDAVTQQEFAESIEHDWQQRPDIDGLAHLPSQLTDAFYRVRFGAEPLSAGEVQTLDASLDRLESWFRNRAAAPASAGSRDTIDGQNGR